MRALHSIAVGFLLSFADRDRIAPSEAPLFSRDFARAYVTTMRPYLFYISGITGILGMALGPTVALLPAAVLAVVFFFSYGFGQALTDCFQTDTDAISSPYRPLVRGIVRRRDVMTVSLVGLAATGVVLTVTSAINLPLVALSVLGLATYTWFKRRWWAGPFYNAWIVAVLMLIGYVSAVGAAGQTLAWPKGLTAALAATFFAYANFVLTGYFKDIAADRTTGYRTLPVVFGRRVSAVVSDLFAAAAVLYAFVAMKDAGVLERATANPLVLLLLIAGVSMSVLAQWRLHQVATDDQAHRSITLVVHAYILLLGAVAAAFQESWALPVVLFYAAFVVTLKLRPMTQQI